jgi:cbb3-type cytochrome oxidase subunit 3
VKLSDVMSHAGLALYAEVALVIFALVFLAVAAYLFIRGSDLDAHAALPLADDVARPFGSEES